MLNKGPHILDAIGFLGDIVGRMHEHQDKQTALLRRLAVSDEFGGASPA
jgi:pyruvate kinase